MGSAVILVLLLKQIVQRAKMLRLVLLCLCASASTMAQNNNTRLFGGLGGLASAFNQITGGNRPNQGFNQGFGGGFGQGGFNQGGFGQGGFGQGGFGQCGFVQPIQPVVQQASCRRWCRTPQGQAYCCESGNEALTAAVTKPGQCPPVRPSCPPTRFGGAPTTCSSDGACRGLDKCCFDTCLQHHTCKPPIGFGRR